MQYGSDVLRGPGRSTRERVAAVLLTAPLCFFSTGAAAGDATGSIAYKGRTANLKFAYLVKGPDEVTKQTIRRLILSATDLSAKIASCTKMSCTDSNLTEGLSVNFDSGPRLNYWMVLNDQKIQYSGTLKPEVLKTTASDTKRMAGKLSFDDAAAGGPKVDVEFDAVLVKDVAAP